jgi:hypothetical protein
MTARDFRRIALSFEGAEEGSHMGNPDFRVGGRIFATLASAKQGYGNLKLTPEQQAEFVRELPEVFVPIHGGWGRMGMTHVKLAAVKEDVLTGALRVAWKVRSEKNAKASGKKRGRQKPRTDARVGFKLLSRDSQCARNRRRYRSGPWPLRSSGCNTCCPQPPDRY